MVRLILLAALAFPALAYTPQDDAPKKGPRGAEGTREFLGLGAAPDKAAAAKGEPVYKQNCGTCHGPTGRGSQAPSLVRSVLVLHDEKGEEIGPVIKAGKPQAGMPAFPNLSAEDISNIAQYLHLQVELAANRGTYSSTYNNLRSQTSGDSARGAQFFAATCQPCHSATGDLAKIGTRFPQAAMMQARFLWPARRGPAKVKVTTATGESITGTLRTLTDFDLSLTDPTGRFHSFHRSEIKFETEDPLAPHRALLPRYTDANIHDLAAYLVTLK